MVKFSVTGLGNRLNVIVLAFCTRVPGEVFTVATISDLVLVQLFAVASTKYEVVALMIGVVKFAPVPSDAPPVAAAYQLTVPAEALALIVTMPASLRAAGVVAVIVGVLFMVATICDLVPVVQLFDVASVKYEVVAVMLGVVKLVPVPNDAPPIAAAYQLMVPVEAEAPKVTVPASQRAAGVVVVIAGEVFMVATISVLALVVRLFAVASTKYEVVVLMPGVVKLKPVPNDEPPVAAAYQLMVPSEAVAPRVTVPALQRAAGAVAVMVGGVGLLLLYTTLI